MKRKTTSKRALQKLSYVPIFEDDDRNMITDIDCCCVYIGDLCEVYEREVNIIKKDLEILECFKKIPTQDLREFIDWQLRYEKIIKNWLDERPFLYIDKEDPTKHLIKIKEWLDEKEKEERMENE